MDIIPLNFSDLYTFNLFLEYFDIIIYIVNDNAKVKLFR